MTLPNKQVIRKTDRTDREYIITNREIHSNIKEKDNMEDFRWTTDYPHPNNTTTMEEYLEQHLPSNLEVIYQEDSYAEIIDKTSGIEWSVHAGGDGDSFNHRIRFEPLYHRMNR